MNRFKTYGLLALCGAGVLATLDTALGLGGSALLADICMTLLEGDSPDGAMADMPMEVKPVPLIALSLAATTVAIVALARDHRRMIEGKSEPDDEERAAILSAMVTVAALRGRTSREELADAYRIVTTHELNSDLLELAYQRFQPLTEAGVAGVRLAPVSSPIGRRRTLAAALMIGCIARPATAEISGLIARISQEIGATSEDVAAAHAALNAWQEGSAPRQGVSQVTVLRHRSLQLSPV